MAKSCWDLKAEVATAKECLHAGGSCETPCFAERARGDAILFEANSVTARTWICIDIVNFYFGLLPNVFCWYLRNYLVHVCLFKLFLASTPSRSRPGNRTIQVNDIFQSYRWLLKSSTCLASNCDPKELQRESEHGKQVWKPGDVSMKASDKSIEKATDICHMGHMVKSIFTI